MRDMRGEMYQSRWGKCMTGSGRRWDAIERLFDMQCRRLGLNDGHQRDARHEGARREVQRELFG